MFGLLREARGSPFKCARETVEGCGQLLQRLARMPAHRFWQRQRRFIDHLHIATKIVRALDSRS